MRRQLAAVSAVLLVAGCSRERRPAPQSTDSATARRGTDTLSDERPDSTVSVPASRRTAPLVLLPAPRTGPLDGAAASLAERAVFAPRNERWFVARVIDGQWLMDIGRLDGGVGTTAEAAAAFDRMAVARSPITPGMAFVAHTGAGPVVATVQRLGIAGRRLTATLDLPTDSATPALPVVLEWRGPGARGVVDSLRQRRAAPCPAAPAAVQATLARLVSPAPVPGPIDSTRRATPGASGTRTSGVAGCFGRWSGVVVTRPTATGVIDGPAETVRLVRADGSLGPGRLRDLSYPYHDLLGTLDVDGDGTHELLVRSYRPAMDTWAVLRMSDSVSFTRLVRGFTIERR